MSNQGFQGSRWEGLRGYQGNQGYQGFCGITPGLQGHQGLSLSGPLGACGESKPLVGRVDEFGVAAPSLENDDGKPGLCLVVAVWLFVVAVCGLAAIAVGHYVEVSLQKPAPAQAEKSEAVP